MCNNAIRDHINHNVLKQLYEQLEEAGIKNYQPPLPYDYNTINRYTQFIIGPAGHGMSSKPDIVYDTKIEKKELEEIGQEWRLSEQDKINLIKKGILFDTRIADVYYKKNDKELKDDISIYKYTDCDENCGCEYYDDDNYSEGDTISENEISNDNNLENIDTDIIEINI